MLAIYPEHQEAVYREQVQLLGDNPNVAPTWEQISKMNYLDRVLKEVMRLNPTPGVLRVLSEDLDLGDYKLPKGCTLYLLVYSLHRDPDFWSHPNEFYPDHFLPEESSSRPKSAYIPFLQGLRSCPGKLYGVITMKILISTAIRMFRFETDMKFEQIKYKYSFLIEMVEGYHVRISRRKIAN
ncbi:hypothetical protein O3M35_012960 [Rhynocoris fuscipes]|uniref:Cytochrome P450 n=1 Tax=Rhynocoris fuscipes TaxID=488301 RepID=A0AAW1CE90_9HEMI